jgi:glutathione synthase/RimK-type ligase-like ATP-grasp enzyme
MISDLPPLIGNAALMRRAMAGDDLQALSAELLARAQTDANDAHALMDLSLILQLNGQSALALDMQRQALQITTLYHLPARRDPAAPGLRLLALMAPGDLMTNTPLDCLLDTPDNDVALDMLYVDFDLPLPPQLPEHDVLFFALGAAERDADLRLAIAAALAGWPRPVLNDPAQIARTGREAAWQALAGIDGLLMPPTQRLDRAALATLAASDLPVIVRPIDSHAGQGLARLNGADELAAYLTQRSEDHFHVSPYIDYRSADGLYRKARVALIDGRPHACHLGISDHWMIHYLNAGMADSATKRAEEAAFMRDFEHAFARRHGAALAALHQRLPLDYLVIDCAETRAGELLIFEVDSGAVVHAMDPVELYPYKQPQMQQVFAAFRTLLEAARQRPPGLAAAA